MQNDYTWSSLHPRVTSVDRLSLYDPHGKSLNKINFFIHFPTKKIMSESVRWNTVHGRRRPRKGDCASIHRNVDRLIYPLDGLSINRINPFARRYIFSHQLLRHLQNRLPSAFGFLSIRYIFFFRRLTKRGKNFGVVFDEARSAHTFSF